ncbi:hypothetical protein SAMN04489809_1210 [Microbacterium paraoxydans]|uniref:Uncharacterized protein n=1 Tax=Microbacterium paraoxydans TaxID=199592 RepID=A0A1H1PWL5_9MICO|nr:hypothetical protein SAMN04489809_1210 [Microbacterium paraoxydans]
MSKRKRTPTVWAFTAALIAAWVAFILTAVLHHN